MLETSKCEKTRCSKALRCLFFSMLLLVIGTLIFYSSLPSWLSHWASFPWLNQFYYTSPQKSISEYFVEYPHEYRFILDEPNRCRKESPFLVLVIPVPPQDRRTRDIIRKTWGNQTTVLGHVVSHFFLLGLSRIGKGTGHPEEKVLNESQQHHDILQSDFLDSYKNLTIKTMVMFQWLSSRCPKASYAMKVDSDMFLNVHKLVGMLLKAPQRLYMTGMVARNALVIRDSNSKWFLPVSAFPESVYPPYSLGLGYVFSLDLTKKILEASSQVKAVYIEDVYVGLCMRHLGFTLTDPPDGGLFMTTVPFLKGNCYWTSVITTILPNSDELLDVWRTYKAEAQSSCCKPACA
ncbi:beta-1,3-galactosyltransferase 2-like isoform X2 [Melanotaenia boesemani]|uniref:beta-1,3-galactosyltransferase 2-like isoform X2 n=1 Tax=Melanotaenia boesemani TaxID=1250792 RepID=UPI001C05BE84|nr:beta-1,3-galactosyltransferase 2-like isoform X2 [Melanotaenia boesemani]